MFLFRERQAPWTLIGQRIAIILLNPGAATLLLFENLNHTGVAALSVLAVYDAIKAFAILR
jgi:hypothetical protein